MSIKTKEEVADHLFEVYLIDFSLENGIIDFRLENIKISILISKIE